MPQLSLYLDEPTMEPLKEKAASAHQSMSKYVATRIKVSDRLQAWPDGFWADLYGCIDDPTFAVPEEVDIPLDDISPFE